MLRIVFRRLFSEGADWCGRQSHHSSRPFRHGAYVIWCCHSHFIVQLACTRLHWLQGCSSAHEAERRMTSTRKALQDHMEFDAEKSTDLDYT